MSMTNILKYQNFKMSYFGPKLKNVNHCMEKQKFNGRMLMNIKYIFSSKMSNL